MTGRVVGNKYALALASVSFIIGSYGLNSVAFNRQWQLPEHLAGAGNWQFLTNLSLAFSLIVFGVGIVAHITRSQRLFKIKNDLHPIGLALESVVASVYWPLRLFFLHLLLKDPSKLELPMKVDLCIHLMPVLSLLIDYFVFMPRWTVGEGQAFGIVCILITAYWFWLHHIIDFENGGEYPYSFLSVPNVYHRIVLFSMIGLSGFGQFLFLKNLYNWVVGKESKE